MHSFTAVFIGFFLLSFGLRFWLASRQIRHVAAHQNALPNEFSSQISLADHQKAAAYTIAKMRLARTQLFAEAGLLAWLSLGGGLQTLIDLGLSQVWLADAPLLSGAVLLLSLGVLGGLIDLPFDWQRQFGIEARFGFNRQTPRGYLADLLRQLALGATLGIPLLLTVLWLMEAADAAWWLWTWAVWAGFNLFLLAIYPTVIAPLFNRFTPLPDPALLSRIEALLARCGFSSQGVFVMDGSRRSGHGNAYFTGLGRSRRVVFFDTLLAQLSPPQIEAVLAHELGHARLHHIRKRLLLMFGLSLAFLAGLAWLKDAIWFYQAFAVATPSNAAALALFFLILPVFSFPFSPLLSVGSRRHEFEADQFAVTHAQGTELISALQKLYSENAATLTPDPWFALFYDSHPKPTERIAEIEHQLQTRAAAQAVDTTAAQWRPA